MPFQKKLAYFQNMDGAPIVCNINGMDYLVGIAKKRHTLSRPVPIVASNVPQYNLEISSFQSGKTDQNQILVDPSVAFGRDEKHNNAAFLQANFVMFLLCLMK